MIALPAGWRRIVAVGADVYASPDRTWQVRCRMRIAPLERVTDVVAAAITTIPEWSTTAGGARERMATYEGEHAFGVSLIGRWLDHEARRYIGVVYGDDTYDTVDVIALGSDPIDARARALVCSATLRLGTRPRRFFYARPTDWRGHATGLTAHWFPPQFPARPSTLVVYPATPSNERPQAVVDAVIAHHKEHGGELRELAAPHPIVARDGLEGMHWSFAVEAPNAPVVVRDLAIFARGAYTYALQLDSVHQPDVDARAVFAMVASSVEPVPVATAGAAPETASVFSHYV